METETKNIKEENVQAETTQEPVVSSLGIPVKTIALIILLAFIAVILLYIALTPKKPNTTNPNTTTTQQEVSGTTLSIADTQKDKAGNYYSDVLIDTGKDKINAVQLELSFDPKVLTIVDIKAGSFFSPSTELLKKIDPINGTISYAITLPLGQTTIGGKGTIARITYSPLQTYLDTVSTINFLPKTEVSSLTSGSSLLKATNDGTVNISATSTNQTSTNPGQINP